MKFEHISAYYSALFPARAGQLDFLEKASPEGNSLFADIACGAGQQAAALTKHGYDVWGLDLEPSMLTYAKAEFPEIKDRFIAGDMRKADEILSDVMPGQPGVVYCIGNSLVQLTDDTDILASLRAFRRLCAPGGSVLIQTVNFDWVFEHNEFMFPKIERALPENSQKVSLEREYLPSATQGCLNFHTILKGPYGTEEKTHKLRALTKPELGSLLRKADFSELSFFGNYDSSEWTADSPATIVKGVKI